MLVCGGIALTIALGVRHNFGLYLQPMTVDLGIGREVFSFAIAIQNLVYGISQPFTGMIADKFGAARVKLKWRADDSNARNALSGRCLAMLEDP